MRKHVKSNVSWVGYLDWDLKKFHGDEYSVGHGSSQNSYLIEEEKTVLVDTVWLPHSSEWLDNLKSEIDLHKIDFIVMNHGEQDHSGALTALMREIPDTPIYCTARAVKSIEGQYGKHGWNFHPVKTGDSIDIGSGKKLIFIEMTMLHWPDSMATYLTGDNILFSMDAFGQHFACGELFNDKADQELLYREAMKYFVNIIHPFAAFVRPKIQEILAMNLPIDIIAPSHGVIWRDNPMQIVDKYAEWADAYQEDQVTVAYDTMWKGTEKLAHAIADEIHVQSPDTRVKVLNLSHEDKNDVMTEVFRSRAIAVGSPTCVNDVLTSVAGWLSMLKTLNFKKKRGGAFGCYGWGGGAVRIIEEDLKKAGFEVISTNVASNWNPDEADFARIPAFVRELLGRQGEDAGYRRYTCPVCGWTYDEAKGLPEQGIPAGTRWEDVPADFRCAVCGETKKRFRKAETEEAQAASKPANEKKEDLKAEESAAGYKKYTCPVCHWTYDEAKGLPDQGIPAGTRWEDLPADFRCPVCHLPKAKFQED